MKYLKVAIKSGALCPFCRSENIQSTSTPIMTGKTVINFMDCLECGEKWAEKYSKFTILTVKQGEENEN